MEVLVEHLDEVVYGLQVAQVVVVDVDADAEVETRVTTVDYLEVAELWAREKRRGDKKRLTVRMTTLPPRNWCVSHRGQ